MEFIDTRHPQTAVSSAAARVLTYCRRQDVSALAEGRHLIDGEAFFLNIFSYQTNAAEARIWEAHRQYIDVHMVLAGKELLGQQFCADCTVGTYHQDSDYLEITPGEDITRFILKPGFLAVFYPEDAHQTGVFTGGEPSLIRKAVFKIRL